MDGEREEGGGHRNYLRFNLLAGCVPCFVLFDELICFFLEPIQKLK